MLFRGLAHTDVADRRRHQGSLGAFQRAQHDLDREGAAILASCGELDARADLLVQRVLGGAQIVGDQPFREALRDDVGNLLSQELVAAVAELLLRLQVQKHNLAALVHHHHRVRSRLQQPAVLALHLRQMLLDVSARCKRCRGRTVSRRIVSRMDRHGAHRSGFGKRRRLAPRH